ncbi:phage holin [Salinibacillus xinjiangensis]|uniref:Phage holin n=1 Tax=Salinibacillus xinjiangensis TaxID=1229268 RepID=A0A6G1X7Y5_9BACI|nr:phage holin [Salinibacillus xinjiangensis]MRG87015.1 phage holin [Salinibacillus xinjiangensis]
MKNMDKGTIIRTVVLAVALINQILVANGVSTLPFTGEQIEAFLTNAFTVVAALVAWFKNNYVTKTGGLQKKALQAQGLIKK